MTAPPSSIEQFLRKDRQLVTLALVLLSLLAWAYLVMLTNQMGMTLTGGMQDMDSMMMLKPWTGSDAMFMFMMWSIMMVGMMIPSAAQMILLYSMVLRKNLKANKVAGQTSLFLLGYLVVWVGFSAVATVAQWGLERAAILSPMMVSTSSLFSGLVLITVGIYQWTPYKNACLEKCRQPVWFLSRIWRNGCFGAFTMGVIHGVFCLGCCWALMALLFVGGVMNLLCVLLITVFVLIEKVAPLGQTVGKIMSWALITMGGYIIIN